MLLGRATPISTNRYAARFGSYRAFYRDAQDLTVSSLGIGTYLGAVTDAATRSYTEAISAAVLGGINFIDTSLNYRNQLSERAIGVALVRLKDHGDVDRNDLVICTKAGFLVPDAVPTGLDPDDVAEGIHSMAPRFLAHQLDRSRENLGVETIDVYYLHNPETQLPSVTREVFESRIRAAFEQMERFVEQGKISYYGTATWDGYRRSDGLSLPRLFELAHDVAGHDHHFRFIQLPYNLAMTEGLTDTTQPSDTGGLSLLETATRMGMTVVASASLLQARLLGRIPSAVAEALGDGATDAQRAIQFVRSSPGVTTALVGMSDPAHVRENLGVAQFPPLPVDRYVGLFRKQA